MDIVKTIFMSIGIRLLVVVFCACLILFPRILGVKKNELPPLMKATEDTNIDRVRSLLARGVDVNAIDADNNTALHYAVQVGDTDEGRKIMRLLVKYNANVRARNHRGLTPLHFVTQIDDSEQRMDVIGDLVKHGAQINARDNKGDTVLDYIVQMRFPGDVEDVLERWGSLLSRDTIVRAKNTAKELGFTDISEVLEKKVIILGKKDATAFDEKTGLNALMLAIMRSDKKMVIDLLKRGADPSKYSRDQHRYLPLHFAVLFQDVSMVETLLQYNAQPNVTSRADDTPLHLVAHVLSDIQRKYIAELLIEAGADMSAKNKDGDTLLHLLVQTNDKPLIAFFVDRYAFQIDLTVKNNKRDTPLSLAEKLERKELLELFAVIEAIPPLARVAP